MAVTKEQIFEAADQIAAAGQRPTLEAVRQIVANLAAQARGEPMTGVVERSNGY